jgi:hypothetical protein
MKFGQKQTRADKVAVASRNKNPKGANDGVKPKTKVKPILKKNTVGFKVTRKF